MLITTRENNLESCKCILIKCVLVAFIVFFSCFLLFNGCGVVKAAESLPANIWEVFETDMSESNYNFDYDYFQSFVENNSLFSVCRYEKPTYVVYYFTRGNVLKLHDRYSSINSGSYVFQYSGARYIATTNSVWNYDGVVYLATVFISFDGTVKAGYSTGDSWGSWNTVSSTSIYYNDSVIGSTNLLYRNYQGSKNSFSHSGIPTDNYYSINLEFNNDYFTYYDFYFANASNNLYLIGTEWNEQFPVSVEDSRLKITTINDSYGNKDLVLDFTEFGTSTNAASYTYSDLSITYTIDDVSYTLTDIDSYIEQIGDVQGLIDIMAFIPYSSLETFTEYNNVILTNVSFTRTISSAGGSGSETFNILTNYYINRSSSESGMENIDYSTDVSGEKATQEQIDTIYYNINFVEGNQISFDDMYEGENTFPSNWSEHYVYLKNVTAAWNDLFQDAAVTPFELFSTITEVCPDVDSAINHISTYLYTTNIANTFDVIIFDYIQETSSSYTHTYWYYTTVCGRIRAMSSIAADLYVDTNQIAVNTKETYNYLKLRLDDFEDKSLNKLDNIISNGNSTLSWLHTIDFDLSSGFNSVVNAINNIDVPEQDNTDIINKLSDVISSLNNISSPVSTNEIDTPQECIEYYRDNINTDIEDIPLQYRVAYFEGMTLDKLYSYGISSNSDTLLASTSDSQYTDQSIFIIKYFYDTILDVMNNSTMYNNLVEGINDLGDSSTYFYDMFDSDFDITVYHGFR